MASPSGSDSDSQVGGEIQEVKRRFRFIEGLREKYRIPPEYEIHHLRKGEDFHSREDDWLTLSTDVMDAGFCLPVQPVAVEVLNHLQLTTLQLTPNSWRTAFVLFIQCKLKGIDLTVELLRSHFSVVASPPADLSVFYLKARPHGAKIRFYK